MSVLSASQLQHRVRIQRPTMVKDTLGAPTQSWVDVATLWADIAPISAREARIAERIAAEVSHQITVRYQPIFADPTIVAQMRVLFKGRVFAIHGALNEDQANVAVILLASEGVRDT